MVMVSPFARAEIAGLKRRSENGAAAMWPPRPRNAAQNAMRTRRRHAGLAKAAGHKAVSGA
jgi:hypothetical protein